MKTLRMAAHVHSSWSYDGSWALADIARVFQRLRYDVVLMAEHDRSFDQESWSEYQDSCAQLSTADLLLVPGIEYEDADNVVHTPVWGTDIPFLGAARPTLEVLRRAYEHDAAILFAHPWRRNAAARYQAEWGSLLSGIEIWSRKYDGVAPNRAAQALARHERLSPFVSLDFHTGRQLFPLAMSADLDRPASAGAVIDAIRSGACRPQLLGLSASHFNHGAGGAAVRSLEAVRRRVRRPLSRLDGRPGRKYLG